MQVIRPSQLSATDLGDLGEDHFSKLCDLSGLTANKALRDRTGWDFVVQFPASDGDARQGYDLRPGSPTCLVQVKTVTRPIKGIGLRLSMAERLVKEALPAFVCVVRLDPQYRVVETLLVHVLDEALAQILKRLRKEFAARAPNLNRKTILLRLPQLPVVVSEIPGAMAIAMSRACGADSQAYAQRKKLQLESVGFPINPYSITGKICGTLEEVVDLFLGLRDSATIKDVTIHEDRFGIRLLNGPPIDSGRLEVEPSPVDECVLSLHFENEEPIAFDLTVYAPGIPGLPEKHQKLLLKGRLFSFVVQGKTWNFISNHGRGSAPPEEWWRFWRLCRAFVTREGAMRVVARKRNVNVFGPFRGTFEGFTSDECQYFGAIAREFDRLLRAAGAPMDVSVSLTELIKHSKHIRFVSALLEKPDTPATMSFVAERIADCAIKSGAIIYLDRIRVGCSMLGYWMTSQIDIREDGNEVRGTLGDFSRPEFRFLKAEEEWPDFQAHATRVTGIDTVMGNAISAQLEAA